MRNKTTKQWAPICALPGCIEHVKYHEKYIKTDGTPGFKWKTFCEFHRTVGRSERDVFINAKGGCENKDGALLPWVCGDPTTPSLTIDHWDGNKHNTEQENVKVLCANCHNRKSTLFKDTVQRYTNVPEKFDDLFEF
jgi:5-methylcytosine-specific restriction endonuclease McrA